VNWRAKCAGFTLSYIGGIPAPLINTISDHTSTIPALPIFKYKFWTNFGPFDGLYIFKYLKEICSYFISTSTCSSRIVRRILCLLGYILYLANHLSLSYILLQILKHFIVICHPCYQLPSPLAASLTIGCNVVKDQKWGCWIAEFRLSPRPDPRPGPRPPLLALPTLQVNRCRAKEFCLNSLNSEFLFVSPFRKELFDNFLPYFVQVLVFRLRFRVEFRSLEKTVDFVTGLGVVMPVKWVGLTRGLVDVELRGIPAVTAGE
jgi:hypothetical protein